MLNRAIMIVGDTPLQASMATLAAVSLVNPLEFGGKLLPYVTVYDPSLN
jgi:hypothetical protein